MCKAFEEWKKEAERIGLERGMQQGIQQGMQQGIRILVEICKGLGINREKILEMLEEKYSLTKADGEKYMELYW